MTAIERLRANVDVYVYADVEKRALAAERAAVDAEIARLRGALEVSLQAMEAVTDEMTVGDRFTNAGQYLIDALMPARAALEGDTP